MWWLLLAGAAQAAEIRGMTISTPTWGHEWGSDAMPPTLDVLSAMGVNWVAIHPYAQIGGDGAVRFRPIDPAAPPQWLVRPIREAHARGMRVMVVPHLAHWGSPFSWRGAIAFPDPTARARFFQDYERWILAVAAATKEADAFVVGSELDATAMHEAEWRSVIKSVRTAYKGPLTYAANWDRFEEVPFWDAVDAIGIQAYFPLSTVPEPSDAALDAAWDQINTRLRVYSKRFDKHVVYTELGYDASAGAAARPWESGGMLSGGSLQQRCLQAALRAIDREPRIIGAFLWKWFPAEAPIGDFRMSQPALRAIIQDAWLARQGAP